MTEIYACVRIEPSKDGVGTECQHDRIDDPRFLGTRCCLDRSSCLTGHLTRLTCSTSYLPYDPLYNSLLCQKSAADERVYPPEGCRASSAVGTESDTRVSSADRSAIRRFPFFYLSRFTSTTSIRSSYVSRSVSSSSGIDMRMRRGSSDRRSSSKSRRRARCSYVARSNSMPWS